MSNAKKRSTRTGKKTPKAAERKALRSLKARMDDIERIDAEISDIERAVTGAKKSDAP